MSQFKTQLSSATLVCLDGNIPTSTINYVCCFAEKHNTNGNQWKDMILKNLKNVLLLIVTIRFPCVSQFGMNRPTQKRLVSLSFQMAGSLCPIHLQTWQSCAPWMKHWVSKHLKVNYVTPLLSAKAIKKQTHTLYCWCKSSCQKCKYSDGSWGCGFVLRQCCRAHSTRRSVLLWLSRALFWSIFTAWWWL